MIKKIITTGLITCMIIGCLTGCKTNESTENSISSETSSEIHTENTTQENDKNKYYEDELIKINIEGKNINIHCLEDYNYSLQEFNEELITQKENFSFEVKKSGYGYIDILVTSDEVNKLYDIAIDIDNNLNLDLTNVYVIDNNEVANPEIPNVSEDLLDIVNTIYDNIDKDLHPEVMNTSLTTAELLYNVGVDELSGFEEGVVSDPMISSIAYSLVVLRFDTKENAQNACPLIKENAPINKWVCVTAEDVDVRVVKDNYVILIMSSKDTVDAVKNVEIN